MSKQIFAAALALVLLAGCGESNDQRANNQYRTPGQQGQNQAQGQTQLQGQNLNNSTQQAPAAGNWDQAARNEANAVASLDLSKLSDIEKEIFQRTVALQQPFYDRQVQWADSATRIVKGDAAAVALETYIGNLDSFARSMQQLDAEMAAKIPAGFTGSPEFDKVLEEYIATTQVNLKTELITQAYAGLLSRFKDHPACKVVMEKLRRMSQQR